MQARWGFLNYDDGILTMAQALRLEVGIDVLCSPRHTMTLYFLGNECSSCV